MHASVCLCDSLEVIYIFYAYCVHTEEIVRAILPSICVDDDLVCVYLRFGIDVEW